MECTNESQKIISLIEPCKTRILNIPISNLRTQQGNKTQQQQFHGGGGEVEYYNDLPGKSPPEFSTINTTVQSQTGLGQNGSSTAHVRDRGTGFRHRPFRGNAMCL